MKMIALPDLHDGGVRFIPQLEPVLRQVDMVLLPGDITTMGKVEDAARIIQLIRTMQPNVLAVGGEWDPRVVHQYLNQQQISLHGQRVMFENAAFFGVGGALVHQDAPKGQILYDNVQFDMFLQEAVQGLSRRAAKILVTHYPPYASQLDMLHFSKQHFGSRSIRTFIEENQPLLCFTGHVHDVQGVEKIGNTFIVNPGPIWLSHAYAYAEVDNNSVTALEIRSL